MQHLTRTCTCLYFATYVPYGKTHLIIVSADSGVKKDGTSSREEGDSAILDSHGH